MNVVWLASPCHRGPRRRGGRHGAMISQYRREHRPIGGQDDPQSPRSPNGRPRRWPRRHHGSQRTGPFVARCPACRAGTAAENIAAGSKTWAETFRMWRLSPGHNANFYNPKPTASGSPSLVTINPLQNLLGHGDC